MYRLSSIFNVFTARQNLVLSAASCTDPEADTGGPNPTPSEKSQVAIGSLRYTGVDNVWSLSARQC